ncbi:hypothetical protein JEQ12_002689 [Ovis aries]|uniref:Pancreatic polypeptide n=1 Tax=Ovis aries TaxID=9940 RepID=A0A836A841_SHEEP|nr:hypothetical protein JEQ12_002689 [Ovis aries]
MAAAHRCLFLLLLSTCVALLLQPPLGALGASLEPEYPGDNATPEQMAQYAAELRRYINMLTRPSPTASFLLTPPVPPSHRQRGQPLTAMECVWTPPTCFLPQLPYTPSVISSFFGALLRTQHVYYDIQLYR